VEEALLNLLHSFLLEHAPKSLIVGKAINVGEDTCDVEVEGETALLDVRLLAVIDNLTSKVLIKPKEGSKVVVGFLHNSEKKAFVTSYSEIEEVIILRGNVLFRVKEKFEMKVGNDSIKDVLRLVIEAVLQIFILYGNNPAYLKLQQALQKLNNIYY
jgi:hypothetical protein